MIEYLASMLEALDFVLTIEKERNEKKKTKDKSNIKLNLGIL